MASAIRLSFHKRLFLQLLVFSWAMVLCFVTFQYFKEREYKSEFLSSLLQQYNQHLLIAIEDGQSYEEYIATHNKPFNNLRITLITLTGAVIYDNTISIESLDNHSSRPEIADALRNGSGYHIGRQSVSDGLEYFYSATCGERVIVRTAIPYSSTLKDLLAADWTFLTIIIAITLSMSFIAYFTTRKLGKDIERVNLYKAEQEKNLLKRQLIHF